MEHTDVQDGADEPQSILSTHYVDRHALKFSQACVVILTGLAFVLVQPAMVLIAALVLLLSTVYPPSSPFRLLYRHVVVPLRLLCPALVEDDPAPHRFAQGIGAAFLAVSSLVLFLILAVTAGWILDLMVFALSGINLFVDFCAGCFVYFHLGRLGLLSPVRYEGGFHRRGV